MRTREEFLKFVLPTRGKYCLWVCQGKDENVRQNLYNSIDELLSKVDGWIESKYNVFFGVNSFKTTENRTQQNVEFAKSFFLDIDVGIDKKNAYPTTEEALESLRAFVKSTGLPKPNIIKSGRGLHVYWVFDREIPKEEWQPYADGFKQLCEDSGLIIDPAVPADSARILRVPYTFHVKDAANPIEAVPLLESEATSFHLLKTLINPIQNDMWANRPSYAKVDETTRALMGNFEHSFKNILVKSVQGNGCAQLAYIYENQESLPEPLWRAGLSIAAHCSDKDKAIHVISKDHPEYSAEATEAKANGTKGPYTCDTFKKLNAEGCANCEHRVSSPIMLDSTIVKSEETTITHEDPDTGETVETPIPEIPFPYFRGRHGGIYKTVKATDEDEEAIPLLVCSRDFYVVRRIKDPEFGESALLRLIRPKDGVSEFLVPLKDIMSRDKFRDYIGREGIPALDKQISELMAYVTKCIEHLQNTSAAAIGKTQMGWQNGHRSFVIGDKEVFADRVDYSPPSSPIIAHVPRFKTAGNFHDWREIVNYYATEEFVQRAYVFFHGFGNVFMKDMPNTKGFLVCSYGEGSGTGKTTTLEAIASIFGDPTKLLMSPRSTSNSIINRLGTWQSVPVLIDEITELPVEGKASLVYAATIGQGAERLEAGRNVERENNVTWQNCVITSSNKALDEEILSFRANPDGILNRMMCLAAYEDVNTDPAKARHHFDRLYKNFGHAFEPFLQYVIANKPECDKLLEQVRLRLEAEAELTSRERFWANDAAATITGGIISNKLNLHNIPIEPVFKYAVEQIKLKRKEKKTYALDSNDVLSQYLYDNIGRMVIANGKPDKRGFDTVALGSPRGSDLAIRIEPDTGHAFISITDFRKYCTKKGVNLSQSLKPHEETGALVETNRHKRLGAGTQWVVLPAIRCYVFDCTKLKDFDMEAVKSAASVQSTDSD